MNLASIRGVVTDLDGVVWRDGQPLPGVPEFFDFLRSRGIPFLMATNNSTRTVRRYVEMLRGIGIEIGPEQVLTSSVATALYLRERYPNGARLYVIGEEGLTETLREYGFKLADRDVAAVVVGKDGDFTFQKLVTANRLIRAGAEFIGTNPDRTFPTPNGIEPGTGAILAGIEAASERSPLIIGKPGRTMFEMALERLGTRADETLMIGDRLETDILGAVEAGLKSALVLSGVTTREKLAGSDVRPDYIFENLAALLESWQAL